MSPSSDGQAAQLRRGDLAGGVYQQSPTVYSWNFSGGRWTLRVWVCIFLSDWVCSLKWVNSVGATSRPLIEPKFGFSLDSTELLLTLQTTACSPTSYWLGHCHQNLEDWKSLRTILAFLGPHETKNLQSEPDFAWSYSRMNGSSMGCRWLCAEHRIIKNSWLP